MINKLDIEISEKLYKNLLIFLIIIILVYIAVTFFSFAIPQKYKMEKNIVMDNDGIIKNGINMLKKGKNRLTLSGWAYKTGQDVKIFNSHFIIKNKQTDKMYILKTTMNIIDQLNNVDEIYDCSKCGLDSQILIFGLKKGAYELYILYENDNENLLVNTGINFEI